VIFALTMLLMSLMVMITVGIGFRAKQRVEAQMAADAAAYSQAVSTARAFNNLAVLNRAAIAHVVALLGVESLISWSGQLYGGLGSIRKALQNLANNCPSAQNGLNKLINHLQNNNVKANFNIYDDQAGHQAREHQGSSGNLKWDDGRDTLYTRLRAQLLNNQNLARQIANEVNPQLDARPAGDRKSLDELAQAVVEGDNKSFISAAMGSRGYSFTSDREGTTSAIVGGLAQIIGPPIQLTVSGAGNGGGGSGFGDDPEGPNPDNTGNVAWHGAQTAKEMNGEAAWAEDHAGSITLRVNNCDEETATLGAAMVISSAREEPTDHHLYGNGEPDPEDGSIRHTLGQCAPNPGCPGVTGGGLTYNVANINDAADDFGQPKTYAIIERSYIGRPNDPWNLFLNFSFGQGTTTRLDLGAQQGDHQTNAGGDLSRQVALGAGLVYYHRPRLNAQAGGFVEPPNMFNPFWRATLAPPDRDAVARLQQAGYPDQAQALQRLLNNNFRGLR
jgi:hypothetical protein